MGDLLDTSDNNFSFNLVNFYSVELLNEVYERIDPAQEEIDHLEILLKQYLPPPSRSLYKINKKAFVISTDRLEQNTLRTMLTYLGFEVTVVASRSELYKRFPRIRKSDVIFVADECKAFAMNIIAKYCKTSVNKPRLIYLNHDAKPMTELSLMLVKSCSDFYSSSKLKCDKNSSRLLFSGKLTHPFFLTDVKAILFDFLPSMALDSGYPSS